MSKLTNERKEELMDELALAFIEDLIALYTEKDAEGHARITSTDRATIARFLGQSGVSFDISLLPKHIRDQLPPGLPKFNDSKLDERPNLKVVG